MVRVTFTSVKNGIIPHDNFYAIDLQADDGTVTNTTLIKKDGKWSECPRGERLEGAACVSEFYTNMQCQTCKDGFVHGVSTAGGADEVGGCFEPIGVKNGVDCYLTKDTDVIYTRCRSCMNGLIPE